MRVLVWILWFFLSSATPAMAGPVVGAAVASFFATLTVKSAVLFGLKIFATVGLNMVMQRLGRKGRQTVRGLSVTATTRGATESETAIIGRYATKGHLSYHNSHGENNKVYQTVIELGGLPGGAVTGVIVDGAYSELGDVEEPTYGFPVLSKRDRGNDHGWVRFYDGTQTAADPTLVAKYGGRTDIPWSEDHIGTGVPYVIFSAWASSKVFPNGAPEQRYERTGIPFYDPRKDSSVGGAGAHRWNDWSTWETTANPVVMIYNILRGLNLPDGSVWGGEAEADDVPLPIWVPGMDVCDVDVDGRPQYEAGYEIHFAEDTPGEVIDELLAACNAQIAEFGGFFYIQVGAPDFAVATITDDDLLVSDSATKDPFPELQNIFNRVTAKYVSPGALWNGTQIDMIRNEEWEVEDGARRTFELDLPAVFNPAQAGQLAEDVLRDQRRWRKHGWPLPPDYSNLRPLSTVNVTSAWNGYDNKLFEVTEIALDLRTLSVVVSLRERDPDDFVINPALEIPDRTSILPAPLPDDAILPGFDANAFVVMNGDGTRGHVAVGVVWDPTDLVDTIKGIAIECTRVEDGEEVWSGTVLNVERGSRIIQPVPPNGSLSVRAKPLAQNRHGTWTAPVIVSTDDVRISDADLGDEFKVVAVPVGLALTTRLVADGIAEISATWSSVTNAVGYEVHLGVSDTYAVGGTSWSLQVVPGAPFSVRVLAVSAIGNKSALSAAESITSAIDIVAPAVPTGLSATGVFEAIWVKWDANSESDFAHYEVVERVSTTGPGVSTVPNYITTTPQFASQDLTGGETLNYWVRAVDTSGNKSGWTARALATAREIGDVVNQDSLQGVIDATSFAAGIEPVTIVTTLPTTKLTETVVFGGKLYRWDGEEYVSTVAATEITGKLTDAQIADLAATKVTGQLSNAQIADLAAIKVTGQLSNAQIAELAAAKLTGQITQTQITDNSISTSKIAAAAITGAKIAAETITAAKIAAGTITGDKISANTITTEKIATGAVQAAQIAAGAVTAVKMALGDFTNAVQDDQFQDEASWTLFSDGQLISDTPTGWGDGAQGSLYSQAFTSTGVTNSFEGIAQSKVWTPTAPGREYRYSYSMRRFNAGRGVGRLAVWFRDKDGVGVGSSGLGVVDTTSDVPVERSGTFTVPANAVAMLFGLQQDKGGTSGVIFRSAIVREMNAGELIVDGTITGTKIAAGAVTADNIAAATITAAKIAAGTITGDKISANTITTALLATGAVQAAQIAAGAITAEKMALGDFTNLIPDDQFQSGAWTLVSGGIRRLVAPDTWGQGARGSIYASDFTSSGLSSSFTTIAQSSVWFPVTPGKEYAYSYTMRRFNSGTGSGRMAIWFQDMNDDPAGSSGLGSVTTSSTIPQLRTGTITIPSDAVRARIGFQEDKGGTSGVIFRSATLREMNAGELIVDGAVQARHIDVNDLVVAGLANINQAYIKSANIIDMNASKLTAGSITTDKLNGRAVSDPTTAFEIPVGGGAPGADPSWNTLQTISVVVPDDGSILMVDSHVNWNLSGSANTSWGVRIAIDGTVTRSVGGGEFPGLVPVRGQVDADAGTYSVTIQATRGGSSIMTVQNLHTVVTNLKR